MLPGMLQNHPHRTLPYLGRILLRFFFHLGSTFSSVRASGNPGAVHNGFFKIIDVDRTIAESAHRFCRSHKLKPYDAVHLACALRAGCDALLTWDSDLLNITHDGIAIAKPQAIGQAVLDLSAPPETVPPIITTVLDRQEPGEDESHASIPPTTTPDDSGVPERLPKIADPPASEEGKKEDDTPPQNGQESAVAERPVESGGDGAGVAKGESVEQPHSSPR